MGFIALALFYLKAGNAPNQARRPVANVTQEQSISLQPKGDISVTFEETVRIETTSKAEAFESSTKIEKSANPLDYSEPDAEINTVSSNSNVVNDSDLNVATTKGNTISDGLFEKEDVSRGQQIKTTSSVIGIDGDNPITLGAAPQSGPVKNSASPSIQSNIDEIDSWQTLASSELLPFAIATDAQLGPVPSFSKSGIPYGKFTTKPYWQIGLLAGAGKDWLSPNDEEQNVSGRTFLETRNLQLGLTRSFNKRLAVTAHAHLSQRHERYRTDFTEQFQETVYNPAALVAGGERFGDSVSVRSSQRMKSDRYATLTRLNLGAVVEYLIPTRFCDYAVFGGINYALIQRWSGSRKVQPEEFSPILEDTQGPYTFENALDRRVSYVIGTRVSKPLGNQLQLLLDTRIVLNSRYSIESAFNKRFSETGHSASLSVGLGWRF